MNINITIPSVVVHVADPNADARHRELLAKLDAVLAQGERLMALNQEMHGLLDQIDQETNRLAATSTASAAKLDEVSNDIDDLIAGAADPTVKARLETLKAAVAAQADVQEAQAARLTTIAAKHETPVPPPVEPPIV